ncbi:MAG: hypothetical protein QNJ98_07700 [Planctomycetota bacterium]|nr:hypothetical protein [Planctomycetota bacterium]
MTAGCGGAQGEAGFVSGIGPGGQPTALEILTTTVPDGNVGATYNATQLAAEGATGPITWEIVDGDLPPGMTVTADGTLFGTPLDKGFYTFTVGASDGLENDTQLLGVSVDSFGAYVESGLQFGDAWSGNSITLRYTAASGPVEVTSLQNGSGGTIVSVNPQTGTIAYMPGQVFTTEVTDELRVTDSASGEYVDIRFPVRANPVSNHIARFGSTDVWKIDFNRKVGAHPFASDWHATLARLGLRHPASTGPGGTEADRLTDMVCRIEVLRHINPLFLRNADGTGDAEALGISFPFEDLPGYVTPESGGRVRAQPYAYNVMSLIDTNVLGIFGAAYVDAVGNPDLEHNGPGSDHLLGVFVNRIADYVVVGFDDYGPELVNQPVRESDIATLKALLFDTPISGLRAEALSYTVHGLAKSVSAVVAHEIGHSCGLIHTAPSRLGSLMNYATVIHEQAEYAFIQSDLDKLRMGLPGPNRGAVALSKPLVAAPALPEHGLQLCED